MNKPFIYYTALTRAVESYNERNLYSRGKIADDLGFVGKNAAIQFSNALNPMNHDKTLNDEKKSTLMHLFDQEDLLIFFNYYMKQFGLKALPLSTPALTAESLHHATDDAMLEGADVFKTVKLALRDKTLTTEELHEIIKEAQEAEDAYALTRMMAEERLEQMEE